MSSQQDKIHAGEPNPGQVDASVHSDSHVEEADQLDPDYVDDGDQSEDELEDELAGAPEAPGVVELTEVVLPSPDQFQGNDFQGRPLPRLPLVGRQEIREEDVHKHHVLSGTKDDIMRWMQEPIQKVVTRDQKYHNFASDSQELANFRDEIRTRVRGFLTPMRYDESVEEGFGFRCEYTGLQCIVGGVRGPLSPSIEAQNAFGWVRLDGERRVLYHSPFTGPGDRENLRIVSWGLNWLHSHHPIAAMPFVGRILRATVDFQDIVQQHELELCFNALTNIGTISAITGNTVTHDRRHQHWADLSPAEAEAVLQTFRTANRSPYVDGLMALFSNQQLFRYRHFQNIHQSLSISPSASECSQLYNWCRRIAGDYGLMLDEFHQLCCIQDPDHSKGYVFFPFYHLSKPEANSQRWNWASCAAFFRHRLDRLKTYCGKASADLGYLDKETWESLLLACAHLWCGMVQRAKDKVASLAGADDSYVKWLILDSFGVPFVWWWNSLLTVSINKRIHGMVMGFGWEKRPGDNGFDPVAHFHLQKSNLSLDSQLTNQAVRNYPLSVWEDIRRLVAAIRFVLGGESPCWDVDETQHRQIWRSEREEPISTFKGKPSIEKVLSSRKVQTLDTSVMRDMPGQSSPEVEVPAGLFAANKARSDKEFWKDAFKFVCEHCTTSFTEERSIAHHQRTICPSLHPDGPERPHQCDGCGYSSYASAHLNRHHKTCTTCPGCKREFPDAKTRAEHQGRCTGKPELVAWPDRLPCDGCGQFSKQMSDLLKHSKTCTRCPNCKAEFPDATARAKHQGECTGKPKLVAWPDHFPCKACDYIATRGENLTRHRKTSCVKCLYCGRDFRKQGKGKARQRHEVNCPERPATPPKDKPIKKKQKSASNKVANPSYSASTASSLPHLKPAAQKSPTKTSTMGGHSTKLDALGDGALIVASGAFGASGASGTSGAAGAAGAASFAASFASVAASFAASFASVAAGASGTSSAAFGTYAPGHVGVFQSPFIPTYQSAYHSAPHASPSLRQDGLSPFPRRTQMYDIPTPFGDRPDWLGNSDAAALMFSGLQYDGSPQDLGSSAASQDTRWLALIMRRYNLAGRLARREWLLEEDISAQMFEIFRGVSPQHMVYDEHAGSLLSPSVHLGNALSRSDNRFGIDDHRNARRVAFSVNTRALFPGGHEQEASHWFLAVYDQTTNTVTIADSQQQEADSLRYSRTLERVVHYLNQLGRGDAIPTLEIRDVPQQKDGASCGLHVLSNLAALVRGGPHHSSDLFELWERRIWNQLGQSTPTRAQPNTSQHYYPNWVSPQVSPPPPPPAKLEFKDTGLAFGDAPPAPPSQVLLPSNIKKSAGLPAGKPPALKQLSLKQMLQTSGSPTPAPAPQIQPFSKSAPPLVSPPAFPYAQQHGIFSPFHSEELVDGKFECNLCHKLCKPKGIRQHINAMHLKCCYCGLRVFRREDIGLHEGKCPKRTIPDSDDGNSDDNIG